MEDRNFMKDPEETTVEHLEFIDDERVRRFEDEYGEIYLKRALEARNAQLQLGFYLYENRARGFPRAPATLTSRTRIGAGAPSCALRRAQPLLR